MRKYSPMASKINPHNFLIPLNHFSDFGKLKKIELNVPTKISRKPIP